MSHTPGPWEAFGKVVRGKGRFICRVNHQDIADDPVIRSETDDARLIAAAPELLKVAIASWHLCESMLACPGAQGRDLIEEIRDAAKAAMEKAGAQS